MQSIQSVDIRSCARIVGATYGAMGLIFCPLFAVGAILGALFGSQSNSGMTIIGSLTLALLMPIAYGALGFVSGALGAWVYNFVAQRFGGIEIELRDVRSSGTSKLGLI